MNNRTILGLLIFLTILGGFTYSRFAIAADCVGGCYTQFEAYIYDGRCWIYDPYQCKDAAQYRFPNDDGGGCIPVSEGEYDPRIDFYDCPTSYCDNLCMNCAAGQLCDHYRIAPIDGNCNYNGELNRSKCSGNS